MKITKKSKAPPLTSLKKSCYHSIAMLDFQTKAVTASSVCQGVKYETIGPFKVKVIHQLKRRECGQLKIQTLALHHLA